MSVGLSYSPLSLEAAFGALLLTTVVALSIADFRQMTLPDRLNRLLDDGRIGQATIIGLPSLPDSLLGALSGFGILAAVAVLFRHARGIHGSGFKDLKFVTAAGLWVGWAEIPGMLLMAACSNLVFVSIRGAQERKFAGAARVPFGLFLGLGFCRSAVAQLGFWNSRMSRC